MPEKIARACGLAVLVGFCLLLLALFGWGIWGILTQIH